VLRLARHPASPGARSKLARATALACVAACADSSQPRDAQTPSDEPGDAAVQDAAERVDDAATHIDPVCDSPSARLGVNYFERFGDGVDSNCDGDDDPRFAEEPCSCDWLDAARAPGVIKCGDGFNPRDAHDALANADVGSPTCATRPDLAVVFPVQCTNDCFGVPIYVSIANLGGVRSGPARIRLVGSFRNDMPSGSLKIEPLDPGQFTPLMDVSATGHYRIAVEADEEQCSRDNDAIEVDAYDAHCGFF
jgi:hypothetical protein